MKDPARLVTRLGVLAARPPSARESRRLVEKDLEFGGQFSSRRARGSFLLRIQQRHNGATRTPLSGRLHKFAPFLRLFRCQ